MGTPAKWGHEFLVNTTTVGDQFQPWVSTLADGRFVVTWSDLSLTGDDQSSYGVRGQIFGATGEPVGAEFLVNTTPWAEQWESGVAGLADGSFVVAWTDQSSGYAVRAQHFGADGTPLGAEFVVNYRPFGGNAHPSVTALPDGRYVVVYDGSAALGDTQGTASYARIFNADGSESVPEFRVNSIFQGDQWRPKVTSLSDGRFVVTWQDTSGQGGDPSGFSVRARIFDAQGMAQGAEFLVNTHTFGSQADPNITALPHGRFVVVWQDYQPGMRDPSGLSARGQLFNADGTTRGLEFVANTTTRGNQSGPCVAAFDDGRYVIAWADSSRTGGDASGLAIKAQLFNADGSKSGSEFLVNTTTFGNQYYHAITALPDGRFVVTWSDDGQTGGDISGFAVRAQIFDPREAAIDLVGTSFGDNFVGTGFGDRMQGRDGNDWLIGKEGDDLLFGNAGNDVLEGRLGNDTLAGRTGDDTLTAGFGRDTFVFVRGGGHDVVTDFRDGVDVIDLTAFGFADFAAAAAQFSQVGPDVVFISATNSLVIENFTLAQLSESDLLL